MYDLRIESKESKLVDYLREQDTENMLMHEKVLLQTHNTKVNSQTVIKEPLGIRPLIPGSQVYR